MLSDRSKWLALFLLCLGDLMIVLDTTIVNVALPSIRTDLGFSETGLVWIINAYMLAFSGFLLLGGRLGDLFGHRRMFLGGIALFTAASLACGLAQSQVVLLVARALQGLGGAVVAAVALSLIITLFTREDERAKAMGFFGFIAAGGGAIGVFLGGLLTGAFDWHWVFLVNIPIGTAVFILCLYYLPKGGVKDTPRQLDIGGAVTVTAALMLAVYAIVGSAYVYLFGSAALFVAFLVIESFVKAPLIPLSIFKVRTVAAVSGIGILWSAAMFAWFFLSALYLQLVLQYTPLQVGLSFLPANIVMALFSVWLSAKMVLRFGTKGPLLIGMLCIAAGLGLFGIAPAEASFVAHVLPGMMLLGIGAGMAFNPVLLIGMSEVPESQAGLASGVLNTAFMMGGSLGLAVLASIAAAVTAGGAGLLAGYHAAFLAGAVCALIAAAIGAVFLRNAKAPKTGALHY